MFDSDLLRFVTAIVFLAVYSVLEQHLQLGILASAALSLTLYWRCNSVLSMMLLAADLFFYCCSYKDFGCIPFLMSETLLICTRSRSEVRGSINHHHFFFFCQYLCCEWSNDYRKVLLAWFPRKNTVNVTAERSVRPPALLKLLMMHTSCTLLISRSPWSRLRKRSGQLFLWRLHEATI